MVQHLVALGPSLLVVAFFLIGVLNWPRQQTWARTTVCLVTFVLALRYMTWRFYATVLPQPFDHPLEGFWVWFVYLIECLALVEIAVFMVIMSRNVDRSEEADRLEAKLYAQGEENLPTVDVFIPTYNEPLRVLERTIIGARVLDYPPDKLKVYVLDDGDRAWLRDFCAENDVNYVTRPEHKHAKAGNINNALAVSNGEFFAVFDADFVPYHNFLRRTLGFFADPAIGIVQTPQHFFNKDPVQSNLAIERYWPDEQRLFFDEMAASRDAWNVSFCCGSCSVLRREAIEKAGGIPTESVTEDLLTTLACLNKGYITRYLNERLSMGLAAEDLEGFFIQRARWCRGGIQSLFLKNGPIFGPGLTLFERIMFLPLSWLIQYFVRFMGLIVPPVFLVGGLAPLYFTDVDDIIYYQLPAVLAYFLFMRWIVPHRYLPIVSTAVGAFTTFRMLPVVIASLIKPFGVPFRVTPKGVEGGNRFDAYTFTCISIVLVATAAGLLINVIPESSVVGHSEFSIVAHYWGAVNILVLLLAALICFEAPRAGDGRFGADERAWLMFPHEQYPVQLVGISLDHSTIRVAADLSARAGGEAVFEPAGVGPFTVTIGAASPRDGETELTLQHASLPPQIRDQMIVKLYTGAYSQEIETLRFGRIIDGLWARAFGATPKLRPVHQTHGAEHGAARS